METFETRIKRIQGTVPDVDGMGYKTDHIQGGAGFSMSRYSHKVMSNGQIVNLFEHFPSPYNPDGKLLIRYSVWLGQTDGGEDKPCPFEIPSGAKEEAWAPDAEVNWYADFGENGEAAEAYALTLSPYTDNVGV